MPFEGPINTIQRVIPTAAGLANDEVMETQSPGLGAAGAGQVNIKGMIPQWRPDIVGIQGNIAPVAGGTGYLDGEITVGMTLPQLYITIFGGALRIWLVQTDTATNSANNQRAGDYNGATNPVCFTDVTP
jgi:hypothetical protein